MAILREFLENNFYGSRVNKIGAKVIYNHVILARAFVDRL